MLRRPPPLSPGSPIAVLAPASPPRDLSSYEEGLARLRETYDVRTAWQSGGERGYLAASDDERVSALDEAIADSEIRAIVCVRGGYGCLRLLPHLDWDLARRHPTLLVGYSDVTALHLAYFARSGWTGVSGPVATEWAKMNAPMMSSFENLVSGEGEELLHGFEAKLATLSSGMATGPLLGGNLSVLSRLIGTPFAPDFEGAILVLEEVCEAPYRVDRMLSQLDGAGILNDVAGVILGHFSTGDLDPDKPTLSLSAVFRDYLSDRSYPVVRGLPYGHLLPRISLPIGATVHLRADRDDVSFIAKSAVVDV